MHDFNSRRHTFPILRPRALAVFSAFLVAAFLATAVPMTGNDALAIDYDLLQDAGDGTYFLGSNPTLDDPAGMFGLNINAADSINADQLWSGGGLSLNLTGSGVNVGVWDTGGVHRTHQDLVGRVVMQEFSPPSGHATHVAGTIGGTGISPGTQGMAPAVTIYSRKYSNDVAEMAADAGVIDISNHSYAFLRGWEKDVGWRQFPGGVPSWMADRDLYETEDPQFGKYRGGPSPVDETFFSLARYSFADAQAVDAVLHDNPDLLAVFAAGNDREQVPIDGIAEYVTYRSGGPSGPGLYLVPNSGEFVAPPQNGGPSGYDTLPNTQVAKNTLVVGATMDHTADPQNPGQIAVTDFSSFGPTDDGRCKPDVVANGFELISPYYDPSYPPDTTYGKGSGTSMAAPGVSGTAALLLEHYRNENGGETPPSATLKGLIMHTATDAGNPGPDYIFGFGQVNGAAAAQLISNADGSHAILEDSFAETERLFDFVAGGGPVKATLAWTDPAPEILPGAGLDDPTPVLVNDLDLWITGPDGIHYPWTLDPANPAADATRDKLNHLDNVVQVWIPDAMAGLYTVHVGGMLGDNTTVENLSQDYSLIVTGMVPEPGTLVGLGWLAVLGLGMLRRRRAVA